MIIKSTKNILPLPCARHFAKIATRSRHCVGMPHVLGHCEKLKYQLRHCMKMQYVVGHLVL